MVDEKKTQKSSLAVSFFPCQIHKQFFLYFFAAGTAAMVDLLTVFLFLQIDKLHYLYAILFGFILGTSTNFLFSGMLVFLRSEKLTWVYLKHFLSSFTGLTVNLSVVIFCVEWLFIPVLLAKSIALLFSFFVNFTLIKFFAFRDMRQ